MEKSTIREIVSDLKAKRDALSLAHEQLKKDNDDWNKCIIVLSLMTGMIESAKIRMGWNSDGMALLPIIMSSIIASVSALIKFKKFPEQMEVLIQSTSLLTNTLNKCRNHTEIDADILVEYHTALEKLETAIYPDIRKKYLRMSHRNLIDIMKIEKKFFTQIDITNSPNTEQSTQTEEENLSSSASSSSDDTGIEMTKSKFSNPIRSLRGFITDEHKSDEDDSPKEQV